MSYNSTAGNGCSLEDCHTNLFALTDLADIKWRKLQTEDSHVSNQDPLEDPVLRSWTQCIQNNILCVWRRAQQSTSQHIHDKLTNKKELWLFWYGSLPTNVDGLIAPELQNNEAENGSWESGLNYECRTLLFKAIHNLIERCLIQQSFVRVGKWFVQPYDYGKTSSLSDRSGHLAIKFSFFLHGESQVCASVDVRQHTPLRRLLPQHFAIAQAHPNTVHVILSPYGLAGILTGQGYKASDYGIHRLLAEWNRFYIVKEPVANSDNECVPLVVEVIVGGTRMCYPSSYVLLTADTEANILQRSPHPSATSTVHLSDVHHPTNMPPGYMKNDYELHHQPHHAHHQQHQQGNATTEQQPYTASTIGNAAIHGNRTSEGQSNVLESCSFISLSDGIVDPPIGILDRNQLGRQFIESIYEDSLICPTSQKNFLQMGTVDGQCTDEQNQQNLHWYYSDPVCKQSCACPKQRGAKQKHLGKYSIKPELGEKTSSDGSSLQGTVRNIFHRRSTLLDLNALHIDNELVHMSATHNGIAGHGGRGPASVGPLSQKQPASVDPASAQGSGVRSSSPVMKTEDDDDFTAAVNSPAAPSPLMAHDPKIQGSHGTAGDATMPTLSPHPPPLNAVGSTNGVVIKDESCMVKKESLNGMNHVAGSDMGCGGMGGVGVHKTALGGINGHVTRLTVLHSSREPIMLKSDCANHWLHKQRDTSIARLKRPVLPTRNYSDDEDSGNGSLYDTNVMDSWLSLPLKKPRAETPNLDYVDTISISINNTGGTRPFSDNGSGSAGGITGIGKLSNGGHHSAISVDPYEFSDEISTTASDGYTRKRSLRTSKDDSFNKQLPFTKKEEENNMNDSVFIGNNEDSITTNTATIELSDSSKVTSLTRREDLIPTGTYKDLLHIFESDSDSGDADMPNPSSNGLDANRLEYPEPSQKDLSVMYPTPPSQENSHHDIDLLSSGSTTYNAVDPYSTTLVGRNPYSSNGNHLTSACGIKSEYDTHWGGATTSVAAQYTEDGIKDWSYVYRPPLTAAFARANKYAPIELPSHRQCLPFLSDTNDVNINAETLTYKHAPQWHQQWQHGYVNNSSAPMIRDAKQSIRPSSSTASNVMPSGINGAVSNNTVSNLLTVPGPGSHGSHQHAAHSTPLHTGSGAPPPAPTNATLNTSTSSAYPSIPSVEAPGSVSSTRNPGTPRSSIMDASPSPYTPQGGPNSQQPPHSAQQRTPLGAGSSYSELQSPMSNASSSYPHLKSVGGSVTNGIRANYPHHLPEVNSVVVNTMLADSLLNLFKDHNFDSCPICACNMNIKGVDVGVYLRDSSTDSQYRCSCGFSAVMNRRYGANSGLFYEDEVDITGMPHDHLDQQHKPPLVITQKTDSADTSLLDSGAASTDKTSSDIQLQNREIVPHEVMALLQEQFSTLYPSSVVLYYYYHKQLDVAQQHRNPMANFMDFKDGCEASIYALDVGKSAMEAMSSSHPRQDGGTVAHSKQHCLHQWPYLQDTAQVPTNAQDVVRFLKALQPLLQDTIHKKRATTFWQSVYTVSGPLTWKDFHLLAGRGSHEASEPRPIPPVLVSHDSEWLTLAPHSIRYWDKLLLEPYGQHRNIAYVVLAPENDLIVNSLKQFFHQLSCVYEQCKLGKHIPVSSKIRDGIIRVGKATLDKLSNSSVDDWFSNIGTDSIALKLKLYAQVCRYKLGPLLAMDPIDNSMFRPPAPTKRPPQPSPAPSPAPPTPDSHPSASPNPGSQQSNEDREHGAETSSTPHKHDSYDDHPDIDGNSAPAIVVYLIEPFTYGDQWHGYSRLATLGLLRGFQEMYANLPQNVQPQVHLQLVPLQTILSFTKRPEEQILKTIALSAYAECRKQVTLTVSARSLTGFGPAAAATDFTKADKPGSLLSTRLFCPPFILAPDNSQASCNKIAIKRNRTPQSSTLMCAYCLSSDQRFLIVSCTDANGAVLETGTINIEVPNRNRRRKASARKIGLAKLWDFILKVIGRTALPWRLVIGRFGRLGHGELKGWVCLLSKRNLIAANKQLKTSCELCSALPSTDIPCIVSACVVSLETHPTVHILPDIVKEEDIRSSKCPLNTPRDASTSHILVFPMSSTAQPEVASNQHEQGGASGMDLSDQFDDALGLDTDLAFDDDIGQIGADMWGELDLLPTVSPNASPKATSPSTGAGLSSVDIDLTKSAGATSDGGGGSFGESHKQAPMVELQNDAIDLLQQPLAMGYYLSTAPCGPLPQWFWSTSAHREGMNPTCFKAALHVHTHHDELHTIPASTRASDHHPMDSRFTCDVLRYVLETYNNLSWLTIDPSTNDRRSCLPAHIVVLMQLYHALDMFV